MGYYLLGINLLAFLLFFLDKQKAKRNKWRISEKTLLIFAALGGSFGALCAMLIFRHKTLHNKFRFGVPALLLCHLILLFVLYRFVL